METKIYLISQNNDFEEQLIIGLGRNRFRIVGNQTNILLALWEIKVIKPKIVILDFDNGNVDAFEIINKIRSDGGNETRFIIVYDNYNHSRIESAERLGVSFCMMRPCDITVLCEKIKSIAHKASAAEILRDAVNVSDDDVVSEILSNIGIPMKCKGYSLLKSAIVFAIEDYSIVGNMMSRLYPKLSVVHMTSVSCVERNIRNAIEIAWNRGNMDYLAEIFGTSIKTKRGIPTSSQFIATIADMIIYSRR